MNSIEKDITKTSDTNDDEGSSGVTFKGTIVGNFKASSIASSSSSSTNGAKNIPKWFKPSGK